MEMEMEVDEGDAVESLSSFHSCPTCGQVFPNLSSIKKHVFTEAHGFMCAVCNDRFHLEATLLEHTKLHTEAAAPPFLSEHPKLHTWEGPPFQCSQCQHLFLRRAALANHQRIHQGTSTIQCSECHKFFSSNKTLKSHMCRHPEEDQPHFCGECGKSFSRQANLRKHLRTHCGQRLFHCAFCHKGFSDKKSLQQHLRTHTGERPFECQECHKLFTQLGSLIEHRRIHTGERPFKCEVCCRSFGSRSNLKKHLLIHTGERPHQCPECHKFYRYKATLVTHMATHRLGEDEHSQPQKVTKEELDEEVDERKEECQWAIEMVDCSLDPEPQHLLDHDYCSALQPPPSPPLPDPLGYSDSECGTNAGEPLGQPYREAQEVWPPHTDIKFEVDDNNLVVKEEDYSYYGD